MLCPQCGARMQQGGIVAQGTAVLWHPQSQFGKSGLRRLLYTGGKPIGKANVFLGQTRLPGAYFCDKCRIVPGVFPVEEHN